MSVIKKSEGRGCPTCRPIEGVGIVSFAGMGRRLLGTFSADELWILGKRWKPFRFLNSFGDVHYVLFQIHPLLAGGHEKDFELSEA